MPLTTLEKCERLPRGFNRAKKRAFLEAYEMTCPNLVQAAQMVRVSPVTLSQHMRVDSWFNVQIESIKRNRLGSIEKTAFDRAQRDSDKTFQDRKLVLSANLPDLYGDKPLVAIQNNIGPQVFLPAANNQQLSDDTQQSTPQSPAQPADNTQIKSDNTQDSA